MPPTSIYYNTLINPATVICYNYKKDGYFTLLYLELKNISNIKKIKKIKKDISKELKKKNPKKRLFFKIPNQF